MRSRTGSDEWAWEEIQPLTAGSGEPTPRAFSPHVVVVMSKLGKPGSSDIERAVELFLDLMRDRRERGESLPTASILIQPEGVSRFILEITDVERDDLRESGWPAALEERDSFDGAVAEVEAEESDGIPSPEIDSREFTDAIGTVPGRRKGPA